MRINPSYYDTHNYYSKETSTSKSSESSESSESNELPVVYETNLTPWDMYICSILPGVHNYDDLKFAIEISDRLVRERNKRADENLLG